MRLIDKIKAKTTRKNRRGGQIATMVAVACTSIIATGIILNPIGLAILTVLGAVAGVKAGKHALKTGHDAND